MRSDKEMMQLILSVAEKTSSVRGVIMNGSRVNPKVSPDPFQDYDIVYVVTELSPFLADHSWVDVFGKRLIMQMPDDIQLYPGDHEQGYKFSYLIQFMDGNRIDLTLYPENYLPKKLDSLSVVLMDKDNKLPELLAPDERDYLVKKPSYDDIKHCTNEFWWVSTYVAKGLARQQFPYAKEMMEGPVRKMLKRMISWYIGANNNFQVNVGTAGKYFEYFLAADVWKDYKSTYADGDYHNMWKALFQMCELFIVIKREVTSYLDYTYSELEETRVYEYLKRVFNKSAQQD
ncbi:aminoglycoside 6-adenylyltransferase [Halobacillus halophilus]|uniref:aminoglycoside 6-adenylyltransferase n=1 Tax=Halobacillus halophilus TaxID=1570 RepID=UPI001CD56869|nr:aminoglycoside 6-adenylyltransferase [Halobacillus halophilus]MCA1009363.1 aminoglycoside 6-adenylyltransferase [Halobacillus halophilus]